MDLCYGLTEIGVICCDRADGSWGVCVLLNRPLCVSSGRDGASREGPHRRGQRCAGGQYRCVGAGPRSPTENGAAVDGSLNHRAASHAAQPTI